jgi:hypothetical protein
MEGVTMFRQLGTGVLLIVVLASGVVSTEGRTKTYGRSTVEYRSQDVTAVASYDYSQGNHAGEWILIEFAVQSKPRIAIDRRQLMLIRPDEQVVPVATQPQFLDDQPTLSVLLQNASIHRRELDGFFAAPRAQRTISFFSRPGGTVTENFVTNLDEVATGNLLFKAPDGRWPAGDYRLVLRHEKVTADLPIRLE